MPKSFWNSLVLGLGVSFSFSLIAHAITVEPTNATSLVSSRYYYPAKSSSNFADNGGHCFDIQNAGLSGTSTSDSDQIIFDVTNSYAPADGKEIVVTVQAKVSGTGSQSLVFVPIYSASDSGLGNIPSVCTSTSCKGTFDNKSIGAAYSNYYESARITQGQTLRIGLYYADICKVAYAQNLEALGCSSGVPISSGYSTSPLTLTFGLSEVDTSSTDPTSVTPKDTSTLTLNFAITPPTFVCPSNALLAESYFPGDGQIKFDATKFTPTKGDAPLANIILVAKKNATPVIDSTFYSANDVVGRVARTETGVIGGFTNTTNGSNNKYQVTFLVSDAAGLIGAPSSATSCLINGLQTAEVEGLLKRDGCFIATAAYGSSQVWTVRILREWRDQVLLQSAWGRDFVNWYYSWAPDAGDWLRAHPALHWPVMLALLPAVLLAWLITQLGWTAGTGVGVCAFLLGVFLLSRRVRLENGESL